MINWENVKKKLTAEASETEPRYVKYYMNEIKKYAFPEIEENINEWALNKPLSEIQIGEWSINKIKMFYPNAYFVDVLQCLSEYKETGCKKIRLSRFDKP